MNLLLYDKKNEIIDGTPAVPVVPRIHCYRPADCADSSVMGPGRSTLFEAEAVPAVEEADCNREVADCSVLAGEAGTLRNWDVAAAGCYQVWTNAGASGKAINLGFAVSSRRARQRWYYISSSLVGSEIPYWLPSDRGSHYTFPWKPWEAHWAYPSWVHKGYSYRQSRSLQGFHWTV